MKDSDIRLAMLNPAVRQRMKELSITTGDQHILNCIETGRKTSAEIAPVLECNMQTVSMRLKTLYKKGYLTRKEVTAKTGGIEYEYQLKNQQNEVQ